MKKIIAVLAAFFISAQAIAATLTPIQLLNPSGSTSGQVIVSTGPSSAPTWGTSGLAAISANSVLANTTGASAAPTAASVPSCSASGNVLQYISNTGFSCATGYAQIASPTFTGTVTTAALTATGAITPSQTAGIIGTTTNNNANAGSVGEILTGTTNTTSLSTGVSANCTSVSLTAGDWDVSGTIRFTPAGTTTVAGILASISITSATLGSFGQYSQIQATLTTGAQQALTTPVTRISLSATSTVYLVGNSAFATSTMTCDGTIRARRVR